MDTKRTILLSVLTAALVLGFMQLQQYAFKAYPHLAPKPPQAKDDTAGGPTTVAVAPHPALTTDAASRPSTFPTSGPTTDASPSVASSTQPAPTIAAASAQWHALPSTRPAGATLTWNSKARDKDYPIRVDLQPLGAAILDVTLTEFNDPADFKKKPSERRPYVYQLPQAGIAGSDSMATRSITIDGTAVDLSNVAWDLESADATSATFATRLAFGSTGESDPGIRVRKTYTAFPAGTPAGDKHGGQGFELAVAYGVSNLTGKPITVSLAFNGPTLPPKEGGRGADRQIVAGYADGAEVHVATPHPVEGFRKDKQETVELLKDDGGRPLLWFGTCSVYFDALVLPYKLDGSAGPVDYLSKVTVRGWNLGDESILAEDRAVTLDFLTTDQKIASGQSMTMPFELYFGPKWRQVLETAHYQAYPRVQRRPGNQERALLDLHDPAVDPVAGVDARRIPLRFPRLGRRDHLSGRDRPPDPSPDHQAFAGPDDEDGQDGPGTG